MEIQQLPNDIITHIQAFVDVDKIHALHRLSLLKKVRERIHLRTNDEWFEHWKTNPFYLPKLIEVCKKTIKYEIEGFKIQERLKKDLDEDWFADIAIYGKKGEKGLLDIEEKRKELYGKNDLYPVCKIKICCKCNNKFKDFEKNTMCKICKINKK